MPLVNVEDYRTAARGRLPRFVFDYLDGGAEDEIALRRNRAAFEYMVLTPCVLNPVAQRDQSVDWLGTRLPTPIIIAPTGLNGLFQREGDLMLARAARRLGIPFTLSTASNASIEQVAATGADFWFQLYVMHRALAHELVDRALAAGASQLVLTVDVPVGGKRERDLRNRFVMPFRLRPGTLLDIACHPRWLWSVGRHGAPAMGNLGGAASKDPNIQAALLSRSMDASFSWDDLARLRDRWPRPLLVKGILHPADVRRAAEIGVDGIVLAASDVVPNADLLRELGIPFVSMDREIATLDCLAATVDTDCRSGAMQSAAYLISRGHRRIAFLSGAAGSANTRMRLEGFEAAHRQAALAVDPALVRCGEFQHSFGRRATLDLLDGTSFTAICCMSDMLAIGATVALRERGLRVPADCAVMGFDNVYLAPLLDQALSTVDRRIFESGRIAIEALIGFLEDPDPQRSAILLETTVVARETA